MWFRRIICSALFFTLVEIIFSQVTVPEELERMSFTLCSTQYHRWEIERNVYVLFCDQAGTKRFGVSRAGEILFEENEMTSPDLPPMVLSYVICNYPQMKISKCYLRKEGGERQTGYRVELGALDLFFSYNGGFVRYEVRNR